MAKLRWYRRDVYKHEEIAIGTFLKIGMKRLFEVEGILTICKALDFQPTMFSLLTVGDLPEEKDIPGVIECKKYPNLSKKEKIMVVRIKEGYLEEVLRYFSAIEKKRVFRLAQLSDNQEIENAFDDIAFNLMLQNILKQTSLAELTITFPYKDWIDSFPSIIYTYNKDRRSYDSLPVVEI